MHSDQSPLRLWHLADPVSSYPFEIRVFPHWGNWHLTHRYREQGSAWHLHCLCCLLTYTVHQELKYRSFVSLSFRCCFFVLKIVRLFQKADQLSFDRMR